MLSVIMPVYNCREYLESAVRSIFNGGVEDIELIAVDDCSSDGSKELLRDLAKDEPRIKAIYNEKNVGVAAVRNIALSVASGEYLAFCDSDDTVPEGSYKKMLDAIGERDVAIGGFCDLSDSGIKRTAFLHPSERASLFTALMSVSCLWTKVLRRSLVVNSGISFDEDMKIGEDVVFLARLSTVAKSYVVIDEIIYNHIHHDGAQVPSLTHIYSLAAFDNHIECRKRLIKICEAAGNNECRSYVYENFSSYLDRFILFISDPKERAIAFDKFKEYMTGYSWCDKTRLFRALFGIEYSDFITATADGYIQLKYDVLPRDTVANEFLAGKIGFRWIFIYIINWLKYKFNKM